MFIGVSQLLLSQPVFLLQLAEFLRYLMISLWGWLAALDFNELVPLIIASEVDKIIGKDQPLSLVRLIQQLGS